MLVANYGREGLRAVRARIEIKGNVFVNFAGRWEWYTFYRSLKGLERFMGYVEDPAQIAVLDLAFRTPRVSVQPTREEWERERLIADYFAPGKAEKRRLAREGLADPASQLPGRRVA